MQATQTFESTGLHPATVAQNVLRAFGIYDETLIDYVIEHTDRVYRANPEFRRILHRLDDPRNYYRQYVEHWITGENRRRQRVTQPAPGEVRREE